MEHSCVPRVMNSVRETSLRRVIPLVLVLALASALLITWLPGAIDAWRLRRTCSEMLEAVLAGKLSEAASHVLDDQRPLVDALFAQYMPAGYERSIASLKLTGVTQVEGRAYAHVVCRFEGEAAGVYMGKLRWVKRDGRWRWDFVGSSGAEFSLTQPQWRSLGDYLPEAGRL